MPTAQGCSVPLLVAMPIGPKNQGFPAQSCLLIASQLAAITEKVAVAVPICMRLGQASRP